ncbi:MAG: S8 family peptidase [Bacteroidetes bacterium]|nr:S8 family peptidase [Bacteroidota bacterium]MBS1539749.1 S8 family peptidase [Bacteroidota bacterium]
MAASRWLLWLLLSPVTLCAQVNRYFVQFKDKAGTVYSVNNPSQFLSQKSIERRARENFVVTSEDFPVNSSYVAQVKATGASVFYSSRWFNGVLIQANASVVPAVAGLPCVSSVQLVAPGAKLVGGRTQTKQKFERALSGTSAPNFPQLQMIGVDQMQQQGYHGEGMDVAVFDGGFIGVNTLSAFQTIYTESRLKETFNFVKNTADVYSDDTHGEEVLSVMAGVSGSYLGGAYKANFYLYETEDVTTEYKVEEYNWLLAAERADSIGVSVISSSLGYSTFDDPSMNYSLSDLNGKTSVISRAARAAALRGMVVVNAAGNFYDASWPKILFPADAEGILACASVDGNSIWSTFSLVGPTADGRIKPDVAAMGSGTAVISSSGSLAGQYGTSFSTPLVASLAVGLRQALPNASAGEIYSRVINSASLSENPNYQLGYGIPNFSKALTLTSFQEAFQLYPNPISKEVKIVFKNPDGVNFSFDLYDSGGQKVLELKDVVTWQNNPYPIDVSAVAAGVYYARVSTPQYTETVRLVRIN